MIGQLPLNFVLLGKTGDGKTTIVNALANYMKFRTFAEAFETDEHCLPMKMRVTSIDQFTKETRIYELGGNSTEAKQLADARVGESVTQDIEIITFQYGDRSVQVIDTPGLSSTQEGPAADEKRMHTIVDFIKDKFTHLNAVCIVVKANESRSTHDFIRNIRNILDNLSKNMGENLVVCMTYSSTTENCNSSEATCMIKDCVRQLSGIDLQPGDIHSFENEAVRVLTENKLNRTNRVDNLRSFRLASLEDRWNSSAGAMHDLFHHIGRLPSRSLHTSSSITLLRQEVSLLEGPLKCIISCIIANKTALLLAVQKANFHRKNREKFIELLINVFKLDELASYKTVCRSAECVKITADALENGVICHENCAEHWWSQKCEKIIDGRCTVCNCDQSFHRRTCYIVRKTQSFMHIPIDGGLKKTLQDKLRAQDVKLKKYIDVATMLSAVLKHCALSYNPGDDNFAKWLKDLRKSYREVMGIPTAAGSGDETQTARVAAKELDRIHVLYVEQLEKKWANGFIQNDEPNEVRQRIKILSADNEYGDAFGATFKSRPLGNPSWSATL